MVVRLPQTEELYPRGRVIVGNGLEHEEHIRHRKIGDWLVQRNKSVQTLDEFDLQNELWEKRFNRWWGWNWLRRRKENLQKFGIKSCAREQLRSMQRAFKSRNSQSVPIYLKQYFDSPSNSTENCSKKLNRIVTPHKQVNFKIRRKKPELEAWLKESSSDSDRKFVKMAPKSTQKRSAKENLNYLDKRLRKMDFEIEKDVLKWNDKDEFVKNVLRKPLVDVSGLKPISIMDINYIPMPRFKYLDRFKLVHNEHKKLSYELNATPFCYAKIDTSKLGIESNSIKTNAKQVNLLPERTFSVKEHKVSNEVKNINYDINYISNNILAFSSQISDINFLYYNLDVT